MLSQIFPGMGQIYGGKKIKGLVFILLGILLEIPLLFVITWRPFVELVTLPNLKIAARVLSYAGLIFWIYVLVDAHATTKKYNKKHSFQIPKRGKEPFLAVFLSVLFPGVGQFYNSQKLKGFGYLLLFSISSLLTMIGSSSRKLLILPISIGFPFVTGIILWASIDAYKQAERINGNDGYILKSWDKRTVYGFFLIWMVIFLLHDMVDVSTKRYQVDLAMSHIQKNGSLPQFTKPPFKTVKIVYQVREKGKFSDMKSVEVRYIDYSGPGKLDQKVA
ncbi:MAG: hypothetical protein HYZ85_00455 [Candidatus Omnitrophica bacterium]|nr:hypothetical protein [Candidatus Omnitrophota bacterium]